MKWGFARKRVIHLLPRNLLRAEENLQSLLPSGQEGSGDVLTDRFTGQERWWKRRLYCVAHTYPLRLLSLT